MFSLENKFDPYARQCGENIEWMGTPFRLQRIPEGRTAWTEEETRKNFEALQRLVSPGKPEASRLLLMRLAHDAGGSEFHPGGKRWTSKDDPEWKEIAQWIKNASR